MDLSVSYALKGMGQGLSLLCTYPSMLPRPLSISLFMSGIVLACRQTLASYSARSVRLLPPRAGSGNVLAVTSRDDKASAMSSYEVVQEAGTSFDGFQVCVWIDSTTATAAGAERRTRSGPFCFDGPQNDLPIQGLELGSHRLSAAAAAPATTNKGDKTPILLSPVAIADFEVVLQEEFVPTYRWQPVRSWQSVPPGLEVELPLDGVTQKRARIPPAWRLQLYVEGEEEGAPGKNGFFLRTDLRAEDTVLKLRQEISRHARCGRPLGCVKLSLEGRVLADGDTMEGLDLFNRQRSLAPIVDRSSMRCGGA